MLFDVNCDEGTRGSVELNMKRDISTKVKYRLVVIKCFNYIKIRKNFLYTGLRCCGKMSFSTSFEVTILHLQAYLFLSVRESLNS